MSARPAWLLREVRGLLLDINGVLFDNTPTGPSAIEGSVAAVNRQAFKSLIAFRETQVQAHRPTNE